MSDRGRDTSDALTEVRTVLSRAKTALEYLSNAAALDGQTLHHKRWDEDAKEWRNTPGDTYVHHSDPDAAEMAQEMREVVAMLEKWRRTGRPRKGSK